jgi:hypothetical protein
MARVTEKPTFKKKNKPQTRFFVPLFGLSHALDDFCLSGHPARCNVVVLSGSLATFYFSVQQV